MRQTKTPKVYFTIRINRQLSQTQGNNATPMQQLLIENVVANREELAVNVTCNGFSHDSSAVAKHPSSEKCCCTDP